jgi:hypothetical protein
MRHAIQRYCRRALPAIKFDWRHGTIMTEIILGLEFRHALTAITVILWRIKYRRYADN